MLTIASTNVTTLKKYEMVEKVTKHMEERKIDIACIQETQFSTNEMIEGNDYNIYFCHGKNQEIKNNDEQHNIKGGVAIRKIYNKNICQINRTDKRIIEIRLKTGISINNISILCVHMRPILITTMMK